MNIGCLSNDDGVGNENVPIAIKWMRAFFFYFFKKLFSRLFSSTLLKWQVKVNLPTESWNRTQFRTRRRNWICPCVYVLQTTSQKEIYGRVRTDCKEKRAGRAKFVFFHLLIGLITVVVTSAFVVAPRIYG